MLQRIQQSCFSPAEKNEKSQLEIEKENNTETK